MSGTWLKNRAVSLFGAEHGVGLWMQEELKRNGLEVPQSSISIMFKKGLNPSTLSSPELLEVYAGVFNCTVVDLLEAHGYNLRGLDFEPTEESLQIMVLVRQATLDGKTDKLKQILATARALMLVD